MSDTPKNPQAFPQPVSISPAGDEHIAYEGMTLRDYFAGQVDVSVYNPNTSYCLAKGHEPTIAELAAYIAEIRMIEADAMLKERAK